MSDNKLLIKCTLILEKYWNVIKGAPNTKINYSGKKYSKNI